MEIRCRLGELLEERGLMKKFIAKKLEVSPQTVSSWIHNNHFIPMDKAFWLADFLGVKVDDLYEIKKDPQ
ncbi:helix-turn-helix domain protein [Bacillus phage vB_BhaS-171]|uniref:helix-turn-helix domain protein n=1 Tax=Bacillus phage vB_BhaS-171 TaxID=1775140 RepID=UPI000744BF1C|nr:helix-turn-helix domain protein [Bacillus phage vB_BhaS-171]ALY08086.1 helix-turn-helix domain protein [Bacillus phage vB_BhaS-171]